MNYYIHLYPYGSLQVCMPLSQCRIICTALFLSICAIAYLCTCRSKRPPGALPMHFPVFVVSSVLVSAHLAVVVYKFLSMFNILV